MKKVTIYRFIILMLLLIFIGFVLSFINGFFGNPISAAIATSRIRTYVQETYPNMDLEVSKATYNFKFSDYFSKVKSNTSMDTKFYVTWSNGRIMDSYEEVTNGYTTYQRLQTELDNKVSDILEKEFRYDTPIDFIDLWKQDGDFSSLTLDMSLDPSNPPLPTTLTVYVLGNEITYDYLVDRLYELSDIMLQHKIHIDFYTLVLQEPIPEGEKPAPDGESLYLYDFPADKLMEKDLIAEIKKHQEVWEEENDKK